jgi:DHA1 family tetracycline resistance protein-like MFS transporter
VASAYIADITSPETRSKRMGLIGMAFGFGFILGPAVGAFSASTLGIAGPGWVAAGFCGANFLLATFILKESKAAHSEHVPSRPRLAQYLHTLHQPQLGLLISIYFLATFCFTCFETTFPLLLLENPHRETLPHVGYLFAYCGLLSALIQGGLIGRLLKVWGEHGLIVGSLLIVAASLALMPYLNSPGGVFLTLGLFATGSGIARPPIFGLISTLAPPNEQGSTLGVAQSAGSLARVVGPVFATAFFAHKPSLPYLLCAAIGLMTCLAAGYRLTRRRSTVAPYEIPSAK